MATATGSRILRIARRGSLVFGWCIAIKLHVADVVLGIGWSMDPTIPHGSIVLIDRLSPHWRQYKRGDVVCLRSPTRTDGSSIIKRILAMEGDHIELRPRFDPSRAQRVVVPKGHVWVEGDNATLSVDSRHMGALPAALLHGRVRAVIWPRKQIQ